MQSRFKRAALFLMKLLLSIALLDQFARGLDLQQLRGDLVSVDPFLFVLAPTLIFVTSRDRIVSPDRVSHSSAPR